MKEKNLEKKIKKATAQKDYEASKFILTDCYIKHFTKMIKYKKGKINKKWYLYDYIIKVKELYGDMYKDEIEEILKVLYSQNYDVKQQIEWLLENSYIFNDYKL